MVAGVMSSGRWAMGVELDERQEGAVGNEQGDRKGRKAWQGYAYQ